MTTAINSLSGVRKIPVVDCSEAGLLARARASDESAVRELIRRNNRLLFRIARGLVKDDAEAEDIVQETYVRAFTRLESFRGNAAFSTWLASIALNEARGRHRKWRHFVTADGPKNIDNRLESSVIMFPMMSRIPGPESETARRQVQEMLKAAVDRLPADFRVVFILRDIEEMSTAAVGEHLGLRQQTVRTRLHRARRLLRADIDKVISSGFADLFPFAGKRCNDMANRVIERIVQK